MRIKKFSILPFFCAIALIGISGSTAFGQTNLALNKNATESSENVWKEENQTGFAKNAVDGDTNGTGLGKIAETLYGQNDSWFEVDLGNYYKIDKIVIHPRTDPCCNNMLKSAYVIVTDQAIGSAPLTDNAKIASSSTFYKFYEPFYEAGQARTIPVPVNEGIGRFVRVQIKGGGAIQIAEIEVFGNPKPIADYKPSGGISGPKAPASTEISLTRDDTGTKIRSGVTAKQSSENVWDDQNSKGRKVGGPAAKAIDGEIGGGLFEQKIVETKPDDNNAYFEIDLGNYYKINKIVIHPRNDCPTCVANFKPFVIVSDQPLDAKPMADAARIFYSSAYAEFVTSPINEKKELDTKGSVGRYVRLQMKGFGQIELSEIEVFGDRTPVAGYKPKSGKEWNTVFVTPFDPNYPEFQGAANEYLTTLQNSPKIIGVKNSDNTFDIAFQDNFAGSKLIRVNTYGKDNSGFKKTGTTLNLTGLGVFGGFTKDANRNRYIFTGTPWTKRGEPGSSKVYKNDQELWSGQFYNVAPEPPKPKTPYLGEIESFMHYGGSRLVIGKDSLLITTNIAPAHPYQVILNTQSALENKNRIFFESQFQHNFGQRAIFDGNDFVIMENRDHDVSVTLSKLNPTDVLPLTGKNDGHALEYVKRIFSVYSHTNMNNNTYTELGNVQKGFGDSGYLVLFSGERDWKYKMSGYTYANRAPNILSPRDIGLVHVKKDFDKETSNWVDKDGKLSMCPAKVDNSGVVNSTGEKTTINYRASEDGWDWANTYNSDGPCKNTLGSDRILETKGVNWVTNYGSTYAMSGKKADADKEFISVNHPKLVRIAQNNYIAIWEEWKAKLGEPKSNYVTTKAVLITLKAATNGEVKMEFTSSPKDLSNKVRLMPGDDAFEFDGKAAWAVGDATKGKLMFYTVDASLNVASFELEL